MDFRTLAAQHSETIDNLNQQLTARDKEIGQLQYRLADISEQTRLSAKSGYGGNEHELHNLQIRVKAAEDRSSDLERQLHDVEVRSERNLRRFSKVEAELDQQIATLQAQQAAEQLATVTDAVDASAHERVQQELATMRAQRDDLGRRLANLQRQFEEEKKSNRRREFEHDMEKAINRNDYDQDDEEPRLPGYSPLPLKQAYRPNNGSSEDAVRASVGPSSSGSTLAPKAIPTANEPPRPAPTSTATSRTGANSSQRAAFRTRLPKPSPQLAARISFALQRVPDINWQDADGSHNGLHAADIRPAPSQASLGKIAGGWNRNFSFTAPATSKAPVSHRPTLASRGLTSNAYQPTVDVMSSTYAAEPGVPRPSLVVKISTSPEPAKQSELKSNFVVGLPSPPIPAPRTDSRSSLTGRPKPTSQSPKRKRKLTQEEEVEKELLELGANNLELVDEPQGTSTKRLRSARTSTSVSSLSNATYPSVSSQSTTASISNLSKNDDFSFEFIAIISYDCEGRVDSHYLSSDIANDVGELWDAIHSLRDHWEDKKGQDWQWEFEKPGYNFAARPCVTRKLEAKRTYWRKGCEGKYACTDCVAANRPCFTFAGEEEASVEEWKFWLLPLHEDDRKVAVEEGFEIRYWLNA
ncbi:hypothetical protein Tdes44962_MAKER08329 [Teratosphaeria destructans]|uniref:Uncharacterized protein n=1 Tax=Teratosphaeria destructans TaxID=418781 RepID=A0A9W7SWZ2_9PEZI|nr:hypothetical protein Tdes44962_MAKER08329 [Teratosphaeria destructans]